ncbi:MAG TPA: hypothetical protein VJC07_05250 [Candidatus Nanoarchaeia archaeon]|nr:hypothetical protein [Candidatus Nanoarchaeia archaeon]
MAGNLPLKKFRVGAYEGVIWENKKEKEDGTEFTYKTITLQRSYKKKDEDVWRSEVINNVRVNDLGKIKAILDRLQDYLFFEAKEEEEGEE